MAAEERRFTAAGETFTYCFERKPIKRINLRVRADGSLAVSAPLRTPFAEIERFLVGEVDFIRRARARSAARTEPPAVAAADGEILPLFGVPHTVRVRRGARPAALLREGEILLTVRDPADTAARRALLERFLRTQAEAAFGGALRRLWPLFAPRPPTCPALCIRVMRSRWGSCCPAANRVTLNLSLVMVPPHLCESVILHELAHFRRLDHSAAFYRELARVSPDYAACRRALQALSLPRLRGDDVT